MKIRNRWIYNKWIADTFGCPTNRMFHYEVECKHTRAGVGMCLMLSFCRCNNYPPMNRDHQQCGFSSQITQSYDRG